MAKNTSALRVHFTVQVSVNAEESSWSSPRGDSNFQVSLPLVASDAVDIKKLLPGLIAEALAEYETKLSQAERDAEAERLAEIARQSAE